MPRSLRLAAALIAALLIAVPAAHAADFEGDDVYTLAAGQTKDGNLYAFGNKVIIEGTVDGDLVAAGSEVTIASTGKVTGDVMAAGSKVLIEGEVEGDVRGAGFVVAIAEGATVGGEVLGAGYSVNLDSGATIAGDYYTAGYQTTLDGEVGGDAHMSGDAIRIRGAVAGDTSVDVDSEGGGQAAPMFPMFGMPTPPEALSPGLNVEEAAKLAGDLNIDYVGKEPDVPAGAVAGTVTSNFTPPSADDSKPEASAPVKYARGTASHFVALLLIGVIGFWLLRRVFERVYAGLADSPLAATGWGCLGLILVPVALMFVVIVGVFMLMIANLITLDGLTQPIIWLGGLLSSILVFGTLFLAWVGRAIVAIWIGRWIWERMGRDASARFWPLVVGCLIVALIAELPLPIIGMLLGWVIAIMGLGGFVMAWKSRALGEPPVEGVAAVPA